MDRTANNVISLSAARRGARGGLPLYGDRPIAATRRPYGLDSVDIPELLAALRNWRRIAPDGVFRYDQPGAMDAILEAGLLTELTAMISATDPDPMNWLLLWWGTGYDDYSTTNATGRTISELPKHDLIAESIKDYYAAIEQRRPVVSCMTGSIIESHVNGAPVYRTVGYDRIVFPLVDAADTVSRLITVSKMFHGDFADDKA